MSVKFFKDQVLNVVLRYPHGTTVFQVKNELGLDGPKHLSRVQRALRSLREENILVTVSENNPRKYKVRT